VSAESGFSLTFVKLGYLGVFALSIPIPPLITVAVEPKTHRFFSLRPIVSQREAGGDGGGTGLEQTNARLFPISTTVEIKALSEVACQAMACPWAAAHI